MSNCIIYALVRWWKHGGVLSVRKSDWGWFPHAFWSSDLKNFEEYQPVVPTHERRFPPLLFRGFVKRFTAEEFEHRRRPGSQS